MDKIKVIALFGKSASGKDTLQKMLVKNYPNTKGIVSCTTRPPREGEKDGVDYNFLSVEEFTKKVLDGTMLEATSFRDWFYGTPLESLDPSVINVGVFNIAGLEAILEDTRLDVYPVYVWADGKTRLLRSLWRESRPNCEEICRRYLADEKDFSELDEDFEYAFLNNSTPVTNTSLDTELQMTFERAGWELLYHSLKNDNTKMGQF